MRYGLRFIVALVGFGIIVLTGSAQALTFTVSDIGFTDIVGKDEAFRWTVSPLSNLSFDLGEAENKTFAYGRFFTDDFPINNPASNDNDDSFKAYFKVTPPGGDHLSKIGVPDATRIQTQEGNVTVDFNNNWIDVVFDIDGLYRIKFLDVMNFSGDANGTQNLLATLEYLRAPTPLVDNDDDHDTRGPTPVPEPSTVVLLGSGLLGLLYMGRRKIRK